MLLRDLAEANKNTASAAAMDNSLNTVRTGGNETPTSVVNASTQSPASNGQSAAGPLSSTNPARTPTTKPNTTRLTRSSDDTEGVGDSSGGLIRSSKRQTSTRPSTGDPCDSPVDADQRTCLNRSIVSNDADLNSTYQDLIAQSRKSGGPDLEERFRQAQREWVNTRDAACRRAGDNTGGLWARPVARCLAEYSARRTAELHQTLNSLRGQ